MEKVKLLQELYKNFSSARTFTIRDIRTKIFKGSSVDPSILTILSELVKQGVVKKNINNATTEYTIIDEDRMLELIESSIEKELPQSSPEEELTKSSIKKESTNPSVEKEVSEDKTSERKEESSTDFEKEVEVYIRIYLKKKHNLEDVQIEFLNSFVVVNKNIKIKLNPSSIEKTKKEIRRKLRKEV